MTTARCCSIKAPAGHKFLTGIEGAGRIQSIALDDCPANAWLAFELHACLTGLKYRRASCKP